MNDIRRFFLREAKGKVIKWLRQGYIVAVLGARQVGKTTLIKELAQKQTVPCFYYSFDDVLLRGKVASDFYFIKKDLEARLGMVLERLDREIYLLIDEAQKEPSVFELLKIFHDSFSEKIKIIVSGSASLEIQKKTSESLAGRAQYVYLFPLSIGEVLREKFLLPKQSLFTCLFAQKPLLEFLKQQQVLLYPHLSELENLLSEILVFGLLPGVWQKKTEEKMGYLRSIVSLYLEKDIRLTGLVKELDIFQNLLEILSFQVGGVLNLTNLSSQVQTSVNTLKNYRSILKNTFVLKTLSPYIAAAQKRLVKNTKVYFYDVGVANFLAGREKIANIFDSKASGGIFENIILKTYEAFSQNETVPVRTYFWRNYQGNEVDLILKKEDRVIPIEITNSTNIVSKKITNLGLFLEETSQADFGLVVYNGELKTIPVKTKQLICLPWWLWW
ncbi:ATP-binding protein [Candidatus Gottesmanbacteria bacterium]|nr:ATP-binding protein [Candidatus Gottesmanbacteria bacterium]